MKKGRHYRNDLPALKLLTELFSYDPDTGDLKWKVRPVSHFVGEDVASKWNARYAGSVAGTRLRRPSGDKRYSEVGIRATRGGRTKLYFCHRIAWLMHYGEDPQGFEIDHIDHDPWNNRISNLRKCSVVENVQNTLGIRVRKHDLPKGVYVDKGCIFSQIRCNGVTHRLGYFKTAEEAHQAYCEAAKRFHGEFACYERKGQPRLEAAPSVVTS